jgi:hypothetical protein
VAVVTPPTCEEGGYTTYACGCGAGYIGDETAPLGHSYVAVVTPPTCEEGGYATYACGCGAGYIGDETAPLGHDYVHGDLLAIYVRRTYTYDAYNYFIDYGLRFDCTRCGDTYNEVTEVSFGIGWNLISSGYNLYYQDSGISREEFYSYFDDVNMHYLFSYFVSVREYNADGTLKKYSSSNELVQEPWNNPLFKGYDYTLNLSVDNGFLQGARVGESTRLYNFEITIEHEDRDDPGSCYHSPIGELIGVDFLD